MFEVLKEKSYYIEWYGKKPHAFNCNDTCEVGFTISGYYVSFIMLEEGSCLIRIITSPIDEDIYTYRKDLYMNSLNSSLIDFEEKFGHIF